MTSLGSESESSFNSLRNWQSLDGAGPVCGSDFSFTGNMDSSNFTSWEILKHWWAASQNWYPLDPRFITNEDHLLTLGVEFVSFLL